MTHYRKIIGLLMLVIISGAYYGCGGAPKSLKDEASKPDFPIVTIDSSKQIMRSDLYNRLAASDLAVKGGILDSSAYFDTLNAIIIDSLVSMGALGVDLKKDRELYRVYRLRFRDYFLDYMYKHYIIDSIRPDTAQLDSFYYAFPQLFTYPEQVHARQMVISAQGLKSGRDSSQYRGYTMDQLDSIARVIIYNLRARIDSGETFSELAYSYSMNRQSGDMYGDLGYFKRHTYTKEFEDTVFSLPKGIISQPFYTPDGWHIAEVIDHIDSGLAPLNKDLYPEIARQYNFAAASKRSRFFIDSVTAAAKIVYNDSALGKFTHQVPETTWAVSINDIDTITFVGLSGLLDYYKDEKGLPVMTLDDKHKALLVEAQKFLIVEAGEKLGIANDSAAAASRDGLYHKYAMDLFEEGRFSPNYTPSDSLIEDYYQNNIDKYVYKKPIYVQQIVTQDSVFAEFLRDQAMSGVDFLKLAEENYPGAEAMRVAAADLGYIGPGDMPDNFYSVASGTAIGNVSHPVKTQLGYHIIKVLDKRQDISLREARGDIINRLIADYNRRQSSEWDRKLISGHKIEYHLSKIAKIEMPPRAERQ